MLYVAKNESYEKRQVTIKRKYTFGLKLVVFSNEITTNRFETI